MCGSFECGNLLGFEDRAHEGVLIDCSALEEIMLIERADVREAFVGHVHVEADECRRGLSAIPLEDSYYDKP